LFGAPSASHAVTAAAAAGFEFGASSGIGPPNHESGELLEPRTEDAAWDPGVIKPDWTKPL
jgi:hypothetical protein